MEIKDLIKMLSFQRPAGSWSEAEYIKQYIEPTGAKPDKVGNYILTIGDEPSILFSSHTDTVHRKPGYQKIYYDKKKDVLHVANKSCCLGADDTTGNWLMLAMINAGIEGKYIFHYGEEIGGIGSSHIADNTPKVLDGIKHAIAFDRMGTEDVIITQGSTCASDEFALELCDALDMKGNKWSPAHGIFTDTANYTHLISECTNISVGYDDQHTGRETQLVKFAVKLRDKLLSIDWGTFNHYRTPVDEWSWWEQDYPRAGASAGYPEQNAQRDWRDNWGDYDGDYRDGWSDFGGESGGGGTASDFARLLELVEDYPEDITAMLIDYGWTAQQVWEALEEYQQR